MLTIYKVICLAASDNNATIPLVHWSGGPSLNELDTHPQDNIRSGYYNSKIKGFR